MGRGKKEQKVHLRDIKDFRTLLSTIETKSNVAVDRSEADAVRLRLIEEHKRLMSANYVLKKKQIKLQKNIEQLKAQNDQSAVNIRMKLEEIHGAKSKYTTLEILAEELSFRGKEDEAKDFAAINSEKEQRLKLNQTFSDKIKHISARADDLTLKRSESIKENKALKEYIRSLLDRYQQNEQSQQKSVEGNATTDTTLAPLGTTEQEESEQDESYAMQNEELSIKIALWRERTVNLQAAARERLDYSQELQDELNQLSSTISDKKKNMDDLLADMQKFATKRVTLQRQIDEVNKSSEGLISEQMLKKEELERQLRLKDKLCVLIKRLEEEAEAVVEID